MKSLAEGIHSHPFSLPRMNHAAITIIRYMLLGRFKYHQAPKDLNDFDEGYINFK